MDNRLTRQAGRSLGHPAASRLIVEHFLQKGPPSGRREIKVVDESGSFGQAHRSGSKGNTREGRDSGPRRATRRVQRGREPKLWGRSRKNFTKSFSPGVGGARRDEIPGTNDRVYVNRHFHHKDETQPSQEPHIGPEPRTDGEAAKGTPSR